MQMQMLFLSIPLLLSFLSPATADDAAVMSEFARRLTSGRWSGNTSYYFCNWEGIGCDTHNKYVTSINLSFMSLAGTLPPNLNSLSHLSYLDLSDNALWGPLPSLAALSMLQEANLAYNSFNSIPLDCFHGLINLRTLTLTKNPFSPWKLLPTHFTDSPKLHTLYLSHTNLQGPLPDIFHSLPNLHTLTLSHNNITATLPNSFNASPISYLDLKYNAFFGTIQLLSSMTNLQQLDLQHNDFTGPIPDFANRFRLRDLVLSYNQLTGVVPHSLTRLSLLVACLDNNKLQGPLPAFPESVFSNLSSNNFCQDVKNRSCDARVNVLLQTASAFGYPILLSDAWKGNDPCQNWSFVTCDHDQKIVGVDLAKQGLQGTISPAFANLSDLRRLNLSNNHLWGPLPDNLTTLAQLEFLDVSNNNLSGDIPSFSSNVTLYVSGNPLLHISGGGTHPGTGTRKPCYTATSPSPSPSHSRHSWTLGTGTSAGIVVIFVVIFSYHKGYLSTAKKRIFKETRTALQQNIEDFISTYGPLVPIRQYSFSEVKRMTNSFQHKLGEGGYGVVYRASLPDGSLVAVKVLNETMRSNGEEFINEVTSISRTSHVNIVSLLGFCYGKKKSALIYEFMSNGSLDKFINKKGSPNAIGDLDWSTLYRIVIGIARGLEYLHQGCNTKILHLDIKPQNILLNEEFCPKISDFGLAKICKKKESNVSLMGTRGTPGYIAPEVFFRSYGRVSHKSDVYSYGMLILEMVGGKKPCDSGSSSQMNFPDWIYKEIEEGNVNANISDEDNDTVKKITLVSMWCIQPNPLNRPPISKVIEMLEGPSQAIPFPPKPILFSPDRDPAQFSRVSSSGLHETNSIVTT